MSARKAAAMPTAEGPASKKPKLEKGLYTAHSVCLVLDYGSQYTQLIARRIRENNVYSMLLPGDAELDRIKAASPKAIILSGGPNSVHIEGAPRLPEGFFEYVDSQKIPVLGICYGMQLLVHELGGKIKTVTDGGEYGHMAIRTTGNSDLYSYTAGDHHVHKETVWMSHVDRAERLPDGFAPVATSEQGAVVACENQLRRIYGLQYHPEVRHTERGMETLKHFLFKLAGISADWKIENILEEEMEKIRRQVGPGDHVICALSGGVDSTVAATLVHKVLGDRLHCVFVDNGLLRYKEAERVMETFEKHLHLPVTKIDDSKRMLAKLKGKTDPEAKRKCIGAGFIEVFKDFAADLKAKGKVEPKFLVQGTLYPDVIESCPPPGSGQKHSHTIKSHHNVGGLPKDLQFSLIEPLRELFKDEVRALGRLPQLNVPEAFIQRHPFPGPGLAVRVLGDVTQGDALDVLRQVDEVYIQSIRDHGLYDKIWQAFAVFLPVRSVGVQGDQRTHSHVVALRAVTSHDGMTADWYPFEPAFLRAVSTRICNTVRSVNRVVYDITSKPPNLEITGVTMTITSSTIGFPRIGPNREMKKALESYWKGQSSLEDLMKVSVQTDAQAWKAQADAGIKLVGLDGTLYDQTLDFLFYLGLVPERFQHLSGYDKYFAMARGAEGAVALDMSKFFDTNYHYMVPELDSSSQPKADFKLLLDKVKRGQEAVGKDKAVPIVIGPNTVVGLAVRKGASRSDLVARLVPAYVDLLQQLKGMGVPEVQMHEPILTSADAAELQKDFESSYAKLAEVGVPLNLVTYYDDIGSAYSFVTKLPVQAISLDFLGVPGSALGCKTADLIKQHGFPKDKRLGAGVVDGRSVYSDGAVPAALVASLLKQGISNVSVQSSVSLQHLPYDVKLEKKLPSEIESRLSFATQKLKEIVDAAAQAPKLKDEDIKAGLPVSDPEIKMDRGLFNRPEDFKTRRPKQIKTPPFPTTSIGSFPQTAEIRRARLQHKKGQLSDEDYEKQVNEYMKYAISEQERIGVDVLVHGEPERSDMVEYFGQKLKGFCFTEAGWVQSYGSRYVRPPIIYADVSRPAAMTVKEFKVAQSLTQKPVKGMLTGPVTILNWSFPRKDLSRQAQAFQLAQALREEVADLEAAGCRVIQVDEPALREGLPLKQERWNSYLKWAVDSFRLATAVAKPETQLVSHLCYSSFEDILEAIDGLDADVLTIENSRSGNEMLVALAKYGYSRDLGPGVYDVHSPVVPSVDFIVTKLKSYVDSGILGGNADRIWANPDCGLKTRDWKEVIPSMDNMVKAAASMRNGAKAKA